MIISCYLCRVNKCIIQFYASLRAEQSHSSFLKKIMDAEQIDLLVAEKVKDAISASQADLMKGIGDLFSQISATQE